MPAGSLVGALVSSFIADRYSRKKAIQCASALWIIGSIIQCASNGVPMLCVGRVVGGFGVGIASSVVPVYQAEIAPKEIRGRVVALQQWAITWGILIQYFIQYGASFVGGGPDAPNQPTAAFRIPWGVQMFPAVLLFFGMFYLPLSPRWLASKDRWDEAVQGLADLHGHGDINNPKVLAEYQEIEEALRCEREETTSNYRQIMKPRILKRVILGASIQAYSQLCGMNIMMYFILLILKSSGAGNIFLIASIQYVINVVLTLPAIIYIDRWGRRPLLLCGSFIMMTFMIITGILQAVFGSPDHDPESSGVTWSIKGNSQASAAVIACTYLMVAAFAFSWGPISWTYPAEILPSKIRARGVGITTAANWCWNCALAFAVPGLLWTINWKMYMIFAAFNLIAFVHIFLGAPETKGKTLEEMDEVFDRGRPAWKRPPRGSRLDRLALEIEAGNLKISGPFGTEMNDMAERPARRTSTRDSKSPAGQRKAAHVEYV